MSFTNNSVITYRKSGVPPDPYIDDVLFLLHFDGANGSTSFIDEKGHAFTRYGNPTISTAQSKFGGSSGSFFYGNQIYSASSYSMGSTPLTIEAWIWLNTYKTGPQQFIYKFQTGFQATLEISSTGRLYNYMSGSAFQTSFSVPIQTWTHIAWTKDSSNVNRLFIGGVQGAQKTLACSPSSRQYIGGAYLSGQDRFFRGYIDDLRVTKNVARYTADFTPPTHAFPNQ